MKALLIALSLASAASVQPAAPPSPGAIAPQQVPAGAQMAADARKLIQSSSDVADPMFGIHAPAVGLERIVHVLQWHRNKGAPGGYDKIWSSERIGPEEMDGAHANPAEFPVNGERWWSADARLDGHPVSTDVLTALEADADARQTWWTIKPDLSQLPVNLAVTFQPDGMLLTTTQDSAHPQVGDVQVEWRAIASAPAPAGLRLVDGHWEMPEKNAVAATSPTASNQVQARSPAATTANAQAWLQRMFGSGAGWLVIAGAALAILLLALRRRR